MQDLPQLVKDRIYFVKFEDLMANPTATMSHIYAWMGLAPHTIDPAKLTAHKHESDSHYRNKYLHKQHGKISSPNQLQYNLYKDAAYAQIWGNGTGGTVTLVNTNSGSGVGPTHTIYGRIPAGQDLPVGVYTDTIVITITF